MKSFFHGTSADNLKKILKEGFRADMQKVWTCSEEGVYFWSPEALEAMGEAENESDAKDRAKQFAFESASCSIAKAKDCRVVVFEVELDSEDVIEDYSCPNMDGAVVHYGPVSADRIKSIWISEDMSLVRGYYIGLMMNRDLSNLTFTDLERAIGKAFMNAEFYVEDMFSLKPYRLKARKA